VTPAADRAAKIRYRIRPGDTLAAIAEKHGTTIRQLQAWNALSSSRIAAGALITIYTSTAKN
jgi:membrane-bound lytic murein transglycosylase D